MESPSEKVHAESRFTSTTEVVIKRNSDEFRQYKRRRRRTQRTQNDMQSQDSGNSPLFKFKSYEFGQNTTWFDPVTSCCKWGRPINILITTSASLPHSPTTNRSPVHIPNYSVAQPPGTPVVGPISSHSSWLAPGTASAPCTRPLPPRA